MHYLVWHRISCTGYTHPSIPPPQGTFGVEVIKAVCPPALLQDLLDTSDNPRVRVKADRRSAGGSAAPGQRLYQLIAAARDKKYDLKYLLPAGGQLQASGCLGVMTF